MNEKLNLRTFRKQKPWQPTIVQISYFGGKLYNGSFNRNGLNWERVREFLRESYNFSFTRVAHYWRNLTDEIPISISSVPEVSCLLTALGLSSTL